MFFAIALKDPANHYRSVDILVTYIGAFYVGKFESDSLQSFRDRELNVSRNTIGNGANSTESSNPELIVSAS
jgi:hypothetical protein